MTGDGTRLDVALVARGLARSRTQAQSLLAAGQVTVAGIVTIKSRTLVADTDEIVTHGDQCPFVSRGGVKLAAALDAFQIPVTGRTALDAGASTGGFSDCLLQRGAAHVFAVDVGHGQLSPGLEGHPRLTYREGVNVRYLSPSDCPAPFEMIVADLSFISLTLVVPALAALLSEKGDMVCLVKPQFEVGAAGLGKGGIVRDDNARHDVLARVRDAAQAQGLMARGHMDSPLSGANGNREFVLWLGRAAGQSKLGVEG